MSQDVIMEAGQRLSQYWPLEAAVTEAAWVRGGQAGGLHGVMHSTPVHPLYTITATVHHYTGSSKHPRILSKEYFDVMTAQVTNQN